MDPLLYCLETSQFYLFFFFFQFHGLYSNEAKWFQTIVLSSTQTLESTRDSMGKRTVHDYVIQNLCNEGS